MSVTHYFAKVKVHISRVQGIETFTEDSQRRDTDCLPAKISKSLTFAGIELIQNSKINSAITIF